MFLFCCVACKGDLECWRSKSVSAPGGFLLLHIQIGAAGMEEWSGSRRQERERIRIEWKSEEIMDWR